MPSQGSTQGSTGNGISREFLGSVGTDDISQVIDFQGQIVSQAVPVNPSLKTYEPRGSGFDSCQPHQNYVLEQRVSSKRASPFFFVLVVSGGLLGDFRSPLFLPTGFMLLPLEPQLEMRRQRDRTRASAAADLKRAIGECWHEAPLRGRGLAFQDTTSRPRFVLSAMEMSIYMSFNSA